MKSYSDFGAFKEAMNRTRDIEKLIFSLQELKEVNRTRATKITSSFENVGAGKSTGGKPNSTELAIQNLIDENNKIEEQLAELVKAQDDIYHMINTLPNDKGKAILTCRLLSCMKFEEIADKLGYECRHVQRIFDDSMKKLFDIQKMS